MNDNKALKRASAITAALRCCGSSPKVDRCKAECMFYQAGSMAKCIPAMTEAAATLIEQLTTELPNDPLTLEELRGMDGESVYIQHIGTCDGFYDDETAPYYGQFEQYIQKYNGMLMACDLPLKYYGEMWLAYRRKPDGGGEQ